MNNNSSPVEIFHILSCYTQNLRDPYFIHQNAVDAFTAQNADENTKNIAVSFALIGLYLVVEKNFSGKEVQNAHVNLGKSNKNWPKFVLPVERGNITVYDVMSTSEGLKRNKAIINWCISVWKSYHSCHDQVKKLVKDSLWND